MKVWSYYFLNEQREVENPKDKNKEEKRQYKDNLFLQLTHTSKKLDYFRTMITLASKEYSQEQCLKKTYMDLNNEKKPFSLDKKFKNGSKIFIKNKMTA